MPRLTTALLRGAIDSIASSSFTIKDIRNRLPQFSVSVVNSAVQRMKYAKQLRISCIVKSGASRYAVFQKTPEYYTSVSEDTGEGSESSWNPEPLAEAVMRMRRR